MSKKTIQDNIFVLHEPENAVPVILDSPHSGSIYPDDFDYACDFNSLRKTEDAYIDELFQDAPDFGASLLCALFPRCYIDTNRARHDVDENLFEGAWPETFFGPIFPTHRSDSGIGLISRIIKPGTPVYDRSLSPEEIINRIQNYYDPYHDALCTVLNDAYYNHGQFWHINLHSMPAASAYPKKAASIVDGKVAASDIVLGDLDGRTSNRDFINMLKEFWRDLGYRVTINDPFKGVELIKRYSHPTRGKNSVQIEINRALYMDEKTGEKNSNFDAFKSHCTDMTRVSSAFAQSKLTQIAAD